MNIFQSKNSFINYRALVHSYSESVCSSFFTTCWHPSRTEPKHLKIHGVVYQWNGKPKRLQSSNFEGQPICTHGPYDFEEAAKNQPKGYFPWVRTFSRRSSILQAHHFTRWNSKTSASMWAFLIQNCFFGGLFMAYIAMRFYSGTFENVQAKGLLSIERGIKHSRIINQ